jgi:glutamyl-tRNA synthetase
MSNTVRVRIAPSPTGKFHLGTARTALFNYLFARKEEGKFIVRIEDTDQTRSEDRYTEDILDGLRWLGLSWDEGPQADGQLGPYFQSQRLALYQQYIDQLLNQKKGYKCFCTPTELEAERKAQQAANQPPKYSGKCAKLSADEVTKNEQSKKPFAVRFIVDHQMVTVPDLIRGDVEFDASLIGDFPITRSDGTPLFVLTNTIDDNLMEISHVFRGGNTWRTLPNNYFFARRSVF